MTWDYTVNKKISIVFKSLCVNFGSNLNGLFVELLNGSLFIFTKLNESTFKGIKIKSKNKIQKIFILF